MTIAEALIRFAKISKKIPEESTCVVCGCTTSRACAGGCSWAHLDIEGDYGICSACSDERLCAVAERLLYESIEGTPWKKNKGCPCPLCARGKKRRA